MHRRRSTILYIPAEDPGTLTLPAPLSKATGRRKKQFLTVIQPLQICRSRVQQKRAEVPPGL